MDDIVGTMSNQHRNQRSALSNLIRDIAPRKRLTAADIGGYVEDVHLRETGHPCKVREVERVLNWTRNHLYSDVVCEYRRYLARVENTERSYWVAVTLWREDGTLTDAGVAYHGPSRP